MDTTLPEITAPSDFRIEAIHNDQNTVDLVGVRVSDQVEIASITNDAPEVFPLGETVVTWTATDSSGNSASATQTITVVDTTSPVLIAPESITQEAINNVSNPVRIGNPETDDIVEVSSITNNAPEVFPLGETVVTWTATDSSGNSASATQTITVVDTTLPIITSPSSLMTEATSLELSLIHI